ncbi:unnamed protein product [Prunus armeniaca]|uniref:Methyltransferase type 11 domain-containing protein n=2 Tax=Prunus TaxID=3754 RepID=A0A6J5XZV5_PRUAR|nr:PREDICTED: uncharacterized protein LOC103339391 [Prunus mume]KAH0971904.1 hypothetical protein GBA52_024060 [Prunus armeniaca]CAB4317255.1 unnamed protein product [Prunus armeniaca]
MNSVFSSQSLCIPLPSFQLLPCLQTQPHYTFPNRVCYRNRCISPLSLSFPFIPHQALRARRSFCGATAPPDEGVVSVINFDDFAEKDWSFLDSADFSSGPDYNLNIDRIISAGEIEETSRVMVSIGSEGFVDRVVESSPCNLLLVVHDSLFVLAGIKEKYDKVKCWQGELIYVPDKWAPLDVVFLYFLPAMPFTLDEAFGALARCFLPGARLVISHPQGREVLEQQRQQYPDVVTSDLPEKKTLQEVAAQHSFELTDYVDEPGFYLAVLKFSGARN